MGRGTPGEGGGGGGQTETRCPHSQGVDGTIVAGEEQELASLTLGELLVAKARSGVRVLVGGLVLCYVMLCYAIQFCDDMS